MDWENRQMLRRLLAAGALMERQSRQTLGFLSGSDTSPLEGPGHELNEMRNRLSAELDAMTMLHDVGALCARSGADFETCLGKLLEAAIVLSGAAKGYLQLVDEGSGSLSIQAHRGLGKLFLKHLASGGEESSACGAALRRGERILAEDISRSPLFAGTHSLKLLLREGVNALQSTPVRGSAGRLLGVITTHYPVPHRFSESELRRLDILARQVADFVERKRIESALRRSEGLLRAVFEQAGIGLGLLDSDGLLVHVNEHFCRIAGRNGRELLGTSPGELSGSGRPDSGEPLRRLRDGEDQSISYETRWARGGDEGVWVQVSHVRIHEDDHPRHFLVAVQDIGQHKRAELQANDFARERQELLEAEQAARREAERAGRLKDDFVATLSHELRTPAQAILGWAQILQRRQEPEDLRTGLETIERNCRAQAQLLTDMLDVSRIVSGRLRLEVRAVDLVDLVQEAIDTVRPAAEARQVRIGAHLDPLAAATRGDPARLQQVVWNLLSNAVKFTPPGGSIEVMLERVGS